MAIVGLIISAVGAAVSITTKSIQGKKARRVAFANDQAADLAALQAGEMQLAEWIEQRAEEEQKQLATLGFMIIGAFLLFIIIVYRLMRS